MKILDHLEGTVAVEEIAAAIVGGVACFIALQTDNTFFKVFLGVLGAGLVIYSIAVQFNEGGKR